MRVSELEANLHAAQIRWDDTIKKNAPLEERLAARKAVLQAERVLSLAQGKETALACEWEVPWEIGAPLPHVVSSGMRTYLIYVANEPDPDWDGSALRGASPGRRSNSCAPGSTASARRTWRCSGD